VYVYRLCVRGTIEQSILARQYGKGLLSGVVGAPGAGWTPVLQQVDTASSLEEADADVRGEAADSSLVRLQDLVRPETTSAQAGVPLPASDDTDAVLCALRAVLYTHVQGLGVEVDRPLVTAVDIVPAAAVD
jgi:hypothetical protein